MLERRIGTGLFHMPSIWGLGTRRNCSGPPGDTREMRPEMRRESKAARADNSTCAGAPNGGGRILSGESLCPSLVSCSRALPPRTIVSFVAKRSHVPRAATACLTTEVFEWARTASLLAVSYFFFFLTGFLSAGFLAARGLFLDLLRLASLFLVPFVAAGRRAVFFLLLVGSV